MQISPPDVRVSDVREASTDGRTRDKVRREVLERGPVSAAVLADTMNLTPAAVRRHLDSMAATGEVASRVTTTGGRGRPARHYVLTDAGHARMTSAYDDLAASALRFLAANGGDAAVASFADARVAELEARYRPVVERAGDDVRLRTAALAGALSEDGYAATARPLAPLRLAGTQLCQGHCPVQHVANEFPQLCEAETAAFSRLLGVHVQRLATLAHGEHVCTTHVPDSAPTSQATSNDQATSNERTPR